MIIDYWLFVDYDYLNDDSINVIIIVQSIDFILKFSLTDGIWKLEQDSFGSDFSGFLDLGTNVDVGV